MSQDIDFEVHGSPQRPAPRASRRGNGPAPQALPTGAHSTCITLGPARREGAASTPHRLTARPGRDIVVLHLQDGPALVLHPEHARLLLQSQQGAGARRDGTAVTVPGELAWPAVPSRGLAGQLLRKAVLRAFELITDVVRDDVAALIASKVVQRVDGQVNAGVYQLQAEAPLQPLKGRQTPLPEVPAAGPEQPLLVLVHGTFVDTASTFSGFWAEHPTAVRALFQHYDNRVYALDHPTLGASPITNALTLAQALPAGAVVHLLTHSRGGLVAEVLVRAAALAAGHGLDDGEQAPWADSADRHYATHRDELQALVQELVRKRLRIERLVRVACPAHGTLLASGRLDAYLSVLQWTLQLAQVPVLPALVDLLGEVARRRADPAQLPGLEAMMPDHPLVRWLNRPLPAGSGPTGMLRVVAGEVQGGQGVLSWVKALLADALYWTDNDIVVHTAAMFGGTPRGPAQALFFRAEGPDATHFDYFRTDRTAQAVQEALLQDRPAGFQPIGAGSAAGHDSSGLRGMPATGGWHLLGDVPPAARSAARPARPLQLGVVNGTLQFVRHALVVGHYRSLKLSGTEAVMDHLLDGVMSQALQAGLYPESPPTHGIFASMAAAAPPPDCPPRPPAVIVVGLGDEGSLRGDDIVSGVRQAVMAHVLQAASAGPAPAGGLTLASTLLGSGSSGISPGAAAQAVATGVRAANLRLREVGWPTVDRLEFVELFLDRATEAWQALQVLDAATPQGYLLDATIEAGLGCLRRPPQAGYRGTGHDLVSAVAAPGATSTRLDGQDVPIEFVLCTRRARNEVRALAPQAQLVRQMVSTAAREGQADADIGRSLFQLLVPAELEPFLAGSEQLVLEVDDSTAGIPWELLDPRRGDDPQEDDPPWALRSRLIRKLRSTVHAPLRPPSRADAPVLVVGEPLCDRPGYPPLPGARQEAEGVAQLLSQRDVEVEHLEGSDAMTVIHRLLARDWRALHLAGHGLYDTQGGGMVLSGDCLLGPREVQAMRCVPELVFVNCCHLGREDATRVLRNTLGERTPLFAATVARQLIDHGVRCVVACGWAVSDAAAQAFAQAFYDALMGGARFIEAVAAGRQAAWLTAPSDNTWAAYQCYGDPDWYWREAPADRPVSAPQTLSEDLGSPAELCLLLESLAVQGRYGRSPPAATLSTLERVARQRWPGVGAVWEALGVAQAAAGLFDAAVQCHAQALACEDASASLQAAEHWARLAARQASETVLAAARSPQRAIAQARTALNAAQVRLSALLQLQPTVERHGLLATLLRQQLLVDMAAGDTTAAQATLQTIQGCWTQALSLARQLHLPPAHMVPARLHEARRSLWEAPDTLGAQLPALREALRARRPVDFQAYAGLAELTLLEALARGDAHEALPLVVQAWDGLHQRIPSPEAWCDVRDDLRALIAMGRLNDKAGRGIDPTLPALLKKVSAWAAPA